MLWFRGRPARRTGSESRLAARWRRLAATVFGIGFSSALLVLALLVVAYFLPVPLLLVPVVAATGAVVVVTDRGRQAEAQPSAPRPWARSLRSRAARVEAAAATPSPSPWPTGRRRRRGRVPAAVTTGRSWPTAPDRACAVGRRWARLENQGAAR